MKNIHNYKRICALIIIVCVLTNTIISYAQTGATPMINEEDSDEVTINYSMKEFAIECIKAKLENKKDVKDFTQEGINAKSEKDYEKLIPKYILPDERVVGSVSGMGKVPVFGKLTMGVYANIIKNAMKKFINEYLSEILRVIAKNLADTTCEVLIIVVDASFDISATILNDVINNMEDENVSATVQGTKVKITVNNISDYDAG